MSVDSLRLASNLSERDRELIRVLQQDGRRPYAQIAREIGADEKTVRRRVQELRAADVIQITTVTDPVVLGYASIAMLGIRGDGTRTPSQLADALARSEAIDHVAVTTGRFELFAEVLARDHDDLRRIVDSEIRPLSGVGEIEILPYLSLHYQEPSWDESRSKGAIDVGRSPPRPIDEMDRKIIAGLNDDGRTPYAVLAERLSVSESQIRQRVRRMTDSRLLRIMAITNPRSLGFGTLAWLAISAAPGVAVAELADQIAELPAIAYLIVCAGRYDILAEAICVDDRDLLELLDRRLRPITGIAGIEASIYLDLRYRRLSLAGGSSADSGPVTASA
jgi:Lrp/AsnC family transcriptional regulator for asnA, asnC and gidA